MYMDNAALLGIAEFVPGTKRYSRSVSGERKALCHGLFSEQIQGASTP